MKKYNILIMFGDTEIAVNGVSDFGYMSDAEAFYFEKDGLRSFVPKCNVRYFGINYTC